MSKRAHEKWRGTNELIDIARDTGENRMTRRRERRKATNELQENHADSDKTRGKNT